MYGVFLSVVIFTSVVSGVPLTTNTDKCTDSRLWIADGRYHCSRLLGPPDILGIYQDRFELCEERKTTAAECCVTCRVVNRQQRPPIATTTSATKYVTTEKSTHHKHGGSHHGHDELGRKFSLGRLPKEVWLQMKRLLSSMYDFAYKQQKSASRKRKRHLL